MDVVKKPKIVQPQKGGQEAFIRSNVDVCFFGGAVAAGKTWAECALHAEPAEDSNYRAIMLRRTLGELKTAGGILDEFEKIYGNNVSITKSENPRIAFKKSGSWIECRQVADENPNKVREAFKGLQADCVCFDELTGFTFFTFNYIMSRARGTAKWTGKIRATTNPSKKHWLRIFLDWYIGPDGFISPEKSGIVRYFYLNGDKVEDVVWGDTKEEVYQKCKYAIDKTLSKMNHNVTYENLIKSFTFIGGSISENEALLSTNPDYVGNVSGKEGQALLEGNWNVDLDEVGTLPIMQSRAEEVGRNEPQIGDKTYIVADLADTGTDNCLIFVIRGLHVLDMDIIPRSTGKLNCAKIKSMARRYNVADSHILYDAQRAENYVVDYIPEAEAIYTFGKARGVYARQFCRLKDECYWRLVECINHRRISFNPEIWNKPYVHQKRKGLTVGMEFMAECNAVQFTEDAGGRKRLIDKKEMKSLLGGNSPDVLDALIFAMVPYLFTEYGNELAGTKNVDEDTYEDDSETVNIYDDSIWC